MWDWTLLLYLSGPLNSFCQDIALCAYVREKAILGSAPDRIEYLKSFANNSARGSGRKAKRDNNKKGDKSSVAMERRLRVIGRSAPWTISVTHEFCQFGKSQSLSLDLQCAFGGSKPAKQLIILR